METSSRYSETDSSSFSSWEDSDYEDFSTKQEVENSPEFESRPIKKEKIFGFSSETIIKISQKGKSQIEMNKELNFKFKGKQIIKLKTSKISAPLLLKIKKIL